MRSSAYLIKALDPSITLNDGAYDLMDVRIPLGTLLNPFLELYFPLRIEHYAPIPVWGCTAAGTGCASTTASSARASSRCTMTAGSRNHGRERYAIREHTQAANPEHGLPRPSCARQTVPASRSRPGATSSPCRKGL
ncbi:hypothetical protein C8R47DRAFT_75291 [Mycena vitilis]|nr:hypothetical protein C8R47DRAFT_75291 [Mycena vitilis]